VVDMVMATMAGQRTVFFISDRTGITAEMLGNSLLTQFEDFQFQRVTIPFVDTLEKIDEAVRQVNATADAQGRRPIVVSSVVSETMSETIRRDANALTLDLFQIFIQPLEAELGSKSSHAAGRSHGIANSHEYFARMEAINFAQAHDDGAATRELGKAQVILVGVSRCGKTPTTLYLALQFGVKAANFPLTPDDFTDRVLPRSVVSFKEKLFGLTIAPDRLHEIRQERRRGSPYAALDNCRYEVREAEQLMNREGIPMIDTTSKSIEEIAATILHRAKLARHIY
jgi:[pyruvate, water dikinase]-phosphate phosphotransferase / [pyruvate, water dikinase] kinase